MNSIVLAKFVLLALLLLFSAFFSGTETALFSLSKIELQRLRDGGGRWVNVLVNYLRNPRKVLATILLGNEIVNISVSVVTASIVYDVVHSPSFKVNVVIAVCCSTALILLFGEILPKNVAIRYASRIAPFVVIPLSAFYYVVGPVRGFLSFIADKVAMLFGVVFKGRQLVVTEEDFRYLVDVAARRGELEDEERKMIHKVFEFGDKVVGDVMTPKSKMFCIDVEKPYNLLLEELKATQFSRVPVYRGNENNIVGILYLKDLFNFDDSRSSVSVADILRKPLFVQVGVRLEYVWRKFRKERIHMAIVLDGSDVVGLVTMDDVLEELFGEMEG